MLFKPIGSSVPPTAINRSLRFYMDASSNHHASVRKLCGNTIVTLCYVVHHVWDTFNLLCLGFSRRPVAGVIHFCPGTISTLAHHLSRFKATVIHEIMHTLVRLVAYSWNVIVLYWHTYKRVLDFTRTHTHFKINTPTRTHARMHARTRTRTHARTPARTHARTHIYTHTYTLTFTDTHTDTHTDNHTHTHIHTHTRTHARTHARTHTHAHALYVHMRPRAVIIYTALINIALTGACESAIAMQKYMLCVGILFKPVPILPRRRWKALFAPGPCNWNALSRRVSASSERKSLIP